MLILGQHCDLRALVVTTDEGGVLSATPGGRGDGIGDAQLPGLLPDGDGGGWCHGARADGNGSGDGHCYGRWSGYGEDDGDGGRHPEKGADGYGDGEGSGDGNGHTYYHLDETEP